MNGSIRENTSKIYDEKTKLWLKETEENSQNHQANLIRTLENKQAILIHLMALKMFPLRVEHSNIFKTEKHR